jgi:hypothetical protein
MPSTAVNRLLDLAKVRLPGVLNDALTQELFHLLNDFFMGTNIWRETLDVSVTSTTSSYLQDPDAYTYDLISEEGGEVFRLMGLVNASGIPVDASMRVPGEIVLKYSPNAAETYKAGVAVTVKDPVDSDGIPQFPEWVLKKYDNAILDGLLGRMMTQAAKPYSNPNLAMAHLRKYTQAKAAARVESARQNVYTGQTWRFPQTFNRTR